MKILNLYAGIGGNRKLWGDEHEITAVEINPEIAKIYQHFFPNDKVIIADAHQYLLDHFKEYDFIWSSPPCPTHSRMKFLHNVKDNVKDTYPDMKLYQEILLLKHFFKGKYVVENVISYYNPLIKPQVCNNHYFWTNFIISDVGKDKRKIRDTTGSTLEYQQTRNGFDLSTLNLTKTLMNKVLNNCVKPEVGLHIFNMAYKHKQGTL